MYMLFIGTPYYPVPEDDFRTVSLTLEYLISCLENDQYLLDGEESICGYITVLSFDKKFVKSVVNNIYSHADWDEPEGKELRQSMVDILKEEIKAQILQDK